MNNDMISHPSHYELSSGLECRDVIRITQGDVLTAGFYEGNVKKYMFRAHLKGKTLEDHKKARQYLDFLIEVEQQLEDVGVDLEALYQTLSGVGEDGD